MLSAVSMFPSYKACSVSYSSLWNFFFSLFCYVQHVELLHLSRLCFAGHLVFLSFLAIPLPLKEQPLLSFGCCTSLFISSHRTPKLHPLSHLCQVCCCIHSPPCWYWGNDSNGRGQRQLFQI